MLPLDCGSPAGCPDASAGRSGTPCWVEFVVGTGGGEAAGWFGTDCACAPKPIIPPKKAVRIKDLLCNISTVPTVPLRQGSHESPFKNRTIGGAHWLIYLHRERFTDAFDTC